MTKKITKDNCYSGYKLLDSYKSKDGYYTKSLKQICDATEYMINKHSRVITFRIDIHSEHDSEMILSSRDVTRCIENTKRNIANRYRSRKNDLDIQTIRTEERNSESAKPHYHLQVFANGNAIKSGYPFFQELSRQVSKMLNSDKKGLVHRCGSEQGSAGVLIDRNSPDFEKQKEQAVRMGSYLAKVKGKEYNQKGSRVSSSSLKSKSIYGNNI